MSDMLAIQTLPPQLREEIVDLQFRRDALNKAILALEKLEQLRRKRYGAASGRLRGKRVA